MHAYALKEPFKKELVLLQQQDIITYLGVYETAVWFKGFVLVPKPNGKDRFSLKPVRLNSPSSQ